MEIIILAGGLGTRLRSIINDVPKPMAPIHTFPFLHYVIKSTVVYKPTKIILCVGYKKEVIQEYFKNNYLGIPIEYSIEEELLGTGGAIKTAVEKIQDNTFLVLNGDSFFDCNLSNFFDFHKNKKAKVSIAGKEMEHFDRYGTLTIDHKKCITNFIEKKYTEKGIINSGIYFIDKQYYLSNTPEGKFSLEEQFFQKYVVENNFYAYDIDKQDFFIDIGIPEDYDKAKAYFIVF